MERISRFGTTDGSLTGAQEMAQSMLSVMFFTSNDSASETSNWPPEMKKLDTFGALLSITRSLSHSSTLKQLSLFMWQGIFRQVIL
jgi:hypothetical protein